MEFIRDLALRRLDVLARTIRDLSPIYDLSESLVKLRVTTGAMTRVDLPALPHLRALSCEWHQVQESIGMADGIEDLLLADFDRSDLTSLAHLASLRSLRMKVLPALRTLDGVDSMHWLAQLELRGAVPLEDTLALASLKSPVLTWLALSGCPRLASLETMQGLPGLRMLDVSEGGDLESLRPVSDLRLLERLYAYGSTRNIDGDLTPVLGLPRVHDLRIARRSHYTPSVSQVKAQLGIA